MCIISVYDSNKQKKFPGYQENATKKDLQAPLAWFTDHIETVIDTYKSESNDDDDVGLLVVVAKQKRDQELKYDTDHFNEYRILNPETGNAIHRVLLGFC